jgi:hypothetical protein
MKEVTLGVPCMTTATSVVSFFHSVDFYQPATNQSQSENSTYL